MSELPDVQTAELRKAVSRAVSRAVARGKIPDRVIESAIERLATIHEKVPIRGLDVCVSGLCTVHLVEPGELPSLMELVLEAASPFKRVEVFPWGIPLDRLRVRIELEDEIAEFVDFRDRGRVFEGDPDGNPA